MQDKGYAPTVRSGLTGAGVGGLGTLLASYLAGNDTKESLRNALWGAAAGGGLGTAYDLFTRNPASQGEGGGFMSTPEVPTVDGQVVHRQYETPEGEVVGAVKDPNSGGFILGPGEPVPGEYEAVEGSQQALDPSGFTLTDMGSSGVWSGLLGALGFGGGAGAQSGANVVNNRLVDRDNAQARQRTVIDTARENVQSARSQQQEVERQYNEGEINKATRDQTMKELRAQEFVNQRVADHAAQSTEEARQMRDDLNKLTDPRLQSDTRAAKLPNSQIGTEINRNIDPRHTNRRQLAMNEFDRLLNEGAKANTSGTSRTKRDLGHGTRRAGVLAGLGIGGTNFGLDWWNAASESDAANRALEGATEQDSIIPADLF